MSLPLPDPFLRGQEDGKSEGAPLRETGLQRWGVGVCFPLAHGFTRCPRCCGVARCRGFRRLPGFAAQEHRLPSLVGGPLLATSFTRVFRSSTWLPGLAVTAPCISIPLSCRPTGPWSEFPSVARDVYNQGTKLGGHPYSDCSRCVSRRRRDCRAMSPSSSQGPLAHLGCAGLSLFFICSMGQLSSPFLPPFPYPFTATPTKQLNLVIENDA